MREVLLITFGIGLGYYLRHLKAEKDEAELKHKPAVVVPPVA
jgi:hypothetical protein